MNLTFYESSRSSSLISSVISTIMLTLPVFGFNSQKHYLNLIKAYLIAHLLNDKTIQPTVIKKADQFISFKFGDIQYPDILKFLCGAASLDSFLKAYQSEETEWYFPYEWFDSSTKLDCNHLPSYDSCFSKLKKSKSFGEGLLSVHKNDGIWERGIRCSPGTGFERETFIWKR